MAGEDSRFGEGGDLRLLSLQNIHILYTFLHGAMRAQFPCSAKPRAFPSLRGKSNKDSAQGFFALTASTGVNASAKIVFIFIDEKIVDLLHHSGDPPQQCAFPCPSARTLHFAKINNTRGQQSFITTTKSRRSTYHIAR